MSDREQPQTVDERSARSGRHPAEALTRGTSVGRYLLLEPLGEGGMGVVYSGYDPELDRQIAIKLLKVHDGAGSRERLLGEAQALARLSHPNVVAVHDVGTFGDHVFVAMERVDGETLTSWLRSGARTVRQIVEVFVAAGEGLAAAHRAGLVHRDFKPDNVMVGADGRIRVLDFGVARSIGAAASDGPAPIAVAAAAEAGASPSLPPPLTQAGAVVGTPAFMAPEQHLGQPIDERADQFSFCVALYWALYGALPFAGATPAEYAENLRAARVAEAAPGARVPRWLREVLLRGLSAAPTERHPSMAALLTALRTDPGRRRRRALEAALALTLTAALVGGVVAVERRQLRLCGGAAGKLAGIWDDGRRAAIRSSFAATGKPYADTVLRTVERAFDDYAQRWAAMTTDACEATHVRRQQSPELLDLRMSCLADELTQLKTIGDLFTHADGALVDRAAQTAQSLPPLERCADVAGLRAPMPPPADAATRQRVREVQKELAEIHALDLAGRYDDGIRRATAAVVRARSLGYRPVEAAAQLGLGQLEVDRGDFARAAVPLRSAVAAAWAGRDDEVAAAAAIRLLEATGLGQQHYEEADSWADLADASLARLPRRDALAGGLYQLRSGLRRQEGRADDALADARRALDTELRLWGRDHHQVALAYRALGLVYYERAAYADALDCLGRAVAIDERALGPEHPEMVPLYSAMANVYADTGDHQRAQAFYARGLRIYERVNPDHPDLASIYSNMGDDLESQGKLREARDRYERAFAVAQRVRGPSRSTAVAEIHLGSVETALGHPAAALPRLQDALAIAQRVLGHEHFICGRALYKMAEAHHRLGRLDLAETEYRRAVAILDKALGAAHPELAAALTGLGRVCIDRNTPDAAIPPLERVVAIYAGLGTPYIGELAGGRFVMAQAEWKRGDRRRALALAADARRGFAAAADWPSGLEVEAWIAKHGAGSATP